MKPRFGTTNRQGTRVEKWLFRFFLLSWTVGLIILISPDWLPVSLFLWVFWPGFIAGGLFYFLNWRKHPGFSETPGDVLGDFRDGSRVIWQSHERVDYREGDCTIEIQMPGHEGSVFSKRRISKSALRQWSHHPESVAPEIPIEKRTEIFRKLELSLGPIEISSD